ncbi:MAG: beta-lactamase class, partial [Patescibacteria group bacterium]|nr:beta-lactamase class [Patescibacteria group bacterium]
YPPERLIKKGETYTMKQLMERMIIDSDNFAYELIIAEMDQSILIQVYNDLDIDIVKLNAEDPDGNILSVKDYPGFFRVLFNASYLSRKNSEEALEMLSKSAYDQGLVAGTPPDTLVAHKYGERFFSFSGIHQLHDCGVVYNRKSPYLLCIMTKGNDFEQLEKFIQDTTRIIDEAHTNTP